MAYDNSVKQIEDRNKDSGFDPDFSKNTEGYLGAPYIYGNWHNWRPQKMYTIEELCFMVDKSKPNMIK